MDLVKSEYTNIAIKIKLMNSFQKIFVTMTIRHMKQKELHNNANSVQF